ncbi:MAG: TIGR02186 family protein [Paracoccaceae bacterium]
MRGLQVLLASLVLSGPAPAEEVVASLSQDRVAITTDFAGSEISIFGAIKRVAPPPEAGPLDVIVAVTGPSRPAVVRMKERRFGIWVNGPGVTVDAAPSLYAVASTRPLGEAISYTEDLRHKISLTHAVRLVGESAGDRYPEEYRRALIRLRRAQGLYFEVPGGVQLLEETLFFSRVALPSQLIEGDYRARILLLRGGEVIDVHEQTIAVQKVGLERWLYTMATEQALLYGILSVAVGLAAGWLASAFFRVIFP